VQTYDPEYEILIALFGSSLLQIIPDFVQIAAAAPAAVTVASSSNSLRTHLRQPKSLPSHVVCRTAVS
jgi:hypothetical protein